MIRVALLRDGRIVQGGTELIDAWSSSKDTPIWIDITGGTQEEIEPLLEERFGFHQLASEDSLSENTLPKYDRFAGYDFLVFRAININVADHGVESIKMACFLGAAFVFTIHPQPLSFVDNIWDRCPQDLRLLQRGPDFLLYSVLDLLVDYHFPILDEFEDRIDEIHDLVFADPSPRLMDELLHLKRDLNILRRYSIPQRELLNQISRGAAQFIKSEHLIYFRDIYDHMFRIGESIDVERDLTSSTMEAYLSVIANRTNDIMKALTMFSAILLPINFIASIYGMNFDHMPELSWRFGYGFAFLLMSIVATIVLAWFWRKGWVWPSRARLLQRARKLRKVLRRGGRPGVSSLRPAPADGAAGELKHIGKQRRERKPSRKV